MSPFPAAGLDDSSGIESPAQLLDELEDALGRVGRFPGPACAGVKNVRNGGHHIGGK